METKDLAGGRWGGGEEVRVSEERDGKGRAGVFI